MALATGRVVGQFVLGVVDGPDPDQEPDVIPAQGTVTFYGAAPYIPLVDAVPNPVTLMTTSIVGVLDAEGYLCTPDPFDPTKPGTRGIRLFANDDPSSPVQGWTWTVTYRFAVSNGATPTIPAHSIAVLSGAELDLTTVVKVPASPGVGEAQAFALVDRAESAATSAADSAADAESVAQSVRDDANNGAFNGTPGVQGPPGNATIRVSETAGRAAYYTKPGTSIEQLFYGDTGWRNISGLTGTAVTSVGQILMCRSDNLVSVHISALNLITSGTAVTFLTLPLGFRPTQLGNPSYPFRVGVVGDIVAGATLRHVSPIGSTGETRVLNAVAGVAYEGSLQWRTNDPWPTSLPGTAVGTIPTA